MLAVTLNVANNLDSRSQQFLRQFALQYRVDYPLLLALGYKESKLAHKRNNKIIQRFESHIYKRLLDIKGGLVKKHWLLSILTVKDISLANDEELKMLSTSYGIYQIMGFHYKSFFYNSVSTMIDVWEELEPLHIKDFCLFCLRHYDGKFLEALQTNNYQRIALMYNGAGYKKNNYDKDLELYHKEFKSLEEK